jgi:hypothetical protein
LKYVSVNSWDENSNLASVKLENGYYEVGDWYDEMLRVICEFVDGGSDLFGLVGKEDSPKALGGERYTR